MTELILAEELFLLTHDERTGRAANTLALDNGLAGALLLDLAGQGLLLTEGTTVTGVPGTASHPLLQAAHAEVMGADRPRSTRHWVDRLPGALKPLQRRLGESLATRGVLQEERRKVLGLFPTTTWPEADPAPERELRRRLVEVLSADVEPDQHLALLVSLLKPLGLVRGLVDKPDRKHADARARQILDATGTAGATSAAVNASVQAVQAAIVAAAIIPAVTAATIAG